MDYGKNSILKQQNDPKAPKIKRKLRLSAAKIIFLSFIAVLVFGICAGFGIINGMIKDAPDITNISLSPSETATYIYDQNGNRIQKLSEPSANRELVTLDQIPLDLQHAVVAIEDERFYTHNGIDIRGIIRAFFVGIKNGSFSEGASTITQQLLKNLVFTDWTSESSFMEKLERKFQEQYLALKLEENLSKEQILENYLNTINLGAGTYGVQAASQCYFNKDVSELTLSECAVIAGITQNPTMLNPITYPDKNAERRQIILQKMLEQGYISQEQYQEALSDNVYERIQQVNEEVSDEQDDPYSYYVDALIEQVLEVLQTEKGYTYQQAYNALYSSGLKIYSAQDPEIQKICDEEFANPENFPSGTQVGLDYALSILKANGETVNHSKEMLCTYIREQLGDPSFNLLFDTEEEARSWIAQYKASVMEEGDQEIAERINLSPQPQASCVVIDQATGYVKAIVGGRGTKEASLTLNRATSSTRQPGSTFKILTAYAPAIDLYGKTLATVYNNAPYINQDGNPITNWDVNSYTGLTTIRSAITSSVNIVAVECLNDITAQAGFDFAQRFGISTLCSHLETDYGVFSDINESLALGGLTEGVYNLELTAAYAAIANKGQYLEPKFFTRIEDRDGNVLIDNSSSPSSSVVKESTAFLLTSAMQDVISSPEGTASDISLSGMPVAGKTGTTSDYRDIWFVAYTPYYTCGIWGGYDNNNSLPSGDIYHSYSRVLWQSIMSRIHENLEIRQFETPSDIVTASVCKKSGKLAIPGICDHDPRGSQIYTEYFASGTEPAEYCTSHISVSICTETGLLASSTCPSASKVFMVLPDGISADTDDGNYLAPMQTCPGNHSPLGNLIGNLTDPQTEAQSETQSEMQTEAQTEAQTNPDPGYQNPGYTDPGYTDPGYTDPGYTDPGYTDPGYTDPGYTNPGYTDPGYSSSGYGDPSSGSAARSSDSGAGADAAQHQSDSTDPLGTLLQNLEME